VEFQDVQYEKNGETVNLRFRVRVTDAGGAPLPGIEMIYNEPVGFEVKRISVPHLLGLVRTYDWKITKVDAPNIPDGGLPL
jgi:hypothetical protein